MEWKNANQHLGNDLKVSLPKDVLLYIMSFCHWSTYPKLFLVSKVFLTRDRKEMYKKYVICNDKLKWCRRNFTEKYSGRMLETKSHSRVCDNKTYNFSGGAFDGEDFTVYSASNKEEERIDDYEAFRAALLDDNMLLENFKQFTCCCPHSMEVGVTHR